jgi:hypothetical protein
MNTHTAPDTEPSRHSNLARASRAASSLGALVSLVFVPKCPLCVAAYLMSLGAGAGAAAWAAPLIRPLALALGVTAFTALLVGAWRGRRRPGRARPPKRRLSAAGCCDSDRARAG